MLRYEELEERLSEFSGGGHASKNVRCAAILDAAQTRPSKRQRRSAKRLRDAGGSTDGAGFEGRRVI